MSNGEILLGQQYEARLHAPLLFTEQMMDVASATAVRGTEGVEIQPQDGAASLVRTWDLAAIAAELDAIFYTQVGTADVQLPDTLESVVITYNKGSTTGERTSGPGAATSSGLSGGLSFHPSSNANSAASILPDVQPNIKQTWGQNLPVTIASFYLPGNVTQAAVLAKLAANSLTTSAWPVWRPVAHTITAKGMQVAVQASAEAHHQDSWNEDSVSAARYVGEGFSKDVSVSVRTVRIPPTIHGLITLSGGASDTATASVNVIATVPVITGTGLAPSYTPALVSDPAAVTATADASVTPTSLAATTPAAIPTEGRYLLDVRVESFQYNYSLVTARVLDFAVFA